MSLIQEDHILFGLPQNKDEALKEISNKALALGIVSQEIITDLQQREAEYSTAIGHGIAIPHARTNRVLRPALIVLKSGCMIDWDGDDVNLCIAILTPENQSQVHLQILSKISRQLMHPEFREALIELSHPQDITKLIKKIEED